MKRLIRKTVWLWQDWQARKKLPVIKAIDKQIVDARKHHAPVRYLFRKKQDSMTALLRGDF